MLIYTSISNVMSFVISLIRHEIAFLLSACWLEEYKLFTWNGNQNYIIWFLCVFDVAGFCNMSVEI